MELLKIKEQCLIDIYDNWKGKSRLEISEIGSLITLCNNFQSIQYYVDHQLLSYPYDQIDGEDLRDLEYHINYYFNIFFDCKE